MDEAETKENKVESAKKTGTAKATGRTAYHQNKGGDRGED